MTATSVSVTSPDCSHMLKHSVIEENAVKCQFIIYPGQLFALRYLLVHCGTVVHLHFLKFAFVRHFCSFPVNSLTSVSKSYTKLKP